jgi:hypothetical protein
MDSSDKTRRTLSEALRSAELGDEALAFVTGEVPPSPSQRADGNAPQRTSAPPRIADAPRPPAQPQEPGSVAAKTKPHFSVIIPAIVSMTFRLPASLSFRLARVSADRKLRRERPFSQQDIVAEALEHWFDRQHESD